MSYYSVANSRCEGYRDAQTKIASAMGHLKRARSELAKNTSSAIDSLIKEIDALIDYEESQNATITTLIKNTLSKARERDEEEERMQRLNQQSNT